MKFLFLPALILAAASPAAETTPAAKQAFGSALGALLQADGQRARDLLLAIAPDQLGEKEAAFRSCTLARLEKPVPAETIMSPKTHQPDSVAQATVTLYRIYWQAGVTHPDQREAAEHQLIASLGKLLGRPSLATMDEVEPLLATRLESNGFHVFQGRTGLLHELMIWAKQDERSEAVALPEGANETRVFYLDDFASIGWSRYLSCDRTGTGGWTKPEGLYVVVPAYASLTDENFRVNFLGHESQHFSDNRRFPGMASWELECRAKLVEVAYAVQTSGHVLSGFAINQGDNQADAHSYANKRVLAALRVRLGLAADADLGSVPLPDLQQAAVAELRADSGRRVKQ
jgi:hypothetical protein